MFDTNDPASRANRKYLRNNMTMAEMELWKYLRGKQFLGLKWRRQFSVGKYILDFYCVSLKLCIEIDGDTHAMENQKEYDITREVFLNKNGIQVIRYTNREIYENREGVLEDLKRKVEGLTPPNLP